MKSFLLDIGNTDTCAGLAVDDNIANNTRAPSFVSAGDFLKKDLDFTPQVAIIASVVKNKTDEWVCAIKEKWGINSLVLTHELASDLIKFNVDDPKSVGADRIADAVASKIFYGSPSIVVDFGTATNIELVNEAGEFAGGIIMTGVWTGMKSLSEFASALFDVRLEIPNDVIGKTTESSVQSGLVFGEVARVDGLIKKIKDKFDKRVQKKMKVVATGGFCSLVAPLCECVDEIDSLLTLKGLNYILNNIVI